MKTFVIDFFGVGYQKAKNEQEARDKFKKQLEEKGITAEIETVEISDDGLKN